MAHCMYMFWSFDVLSLATVASTGWLMAHCMYMFWSFDVVSIQVIEPPSGMLFA
jgi:hypothetical protein